MNPPGWKQSFYRKRRTKSCSNYKPYSWRGWGKKRWIYWFLRSHAQSDTWLVWSQNQIFHRSCSLQNIRNIIKVISFSCNTSKNNENQDAYVFILFLVDNLGNDVENLFQDSFPLSSKAMFAFKLITWSNFVREVFLLTTC